MANLLLFWASESNRSLSRASRVRHRHRSHGMLDGLLGRGFAAKWFDTAISLLFCFFLWLFSTRFGFWWSNRGGVWECSYHNYDAVFLFFLWFFLFDFQQIVDQIDEESDRCDKEEEEGDREVSEERHRWSVVEWFRCQCLRKGNCFFVIIIIYYYYYYYLFSAIYLSDLVMWDSSLEIESIIAELLNLSDWYFTVNRACRVLVLLDSTVSQRMQNGFSLFFWCFETLYFIQFRMELESNENYFSTFFFLFNVSESLNSYWIVIYYNCSCLIEIGLVRVLNVSMILLCCLQHNIFYV